MNLLNIKWTMSHNDSIGRATGHYRSPEMGREFHKKVTILSIVDCPERAYNFGLHQSWKFLQVYE